MISFLITGYYGFLNSGDDAILTAMCEGIKRLEIPTKITILSNNPQATEMEYGVHATYRFNLVSVIKAILQADILLMGGGSLLQDKTSTRSLLYYLSILGLAKMFRKKVMIYANGIGPISRRPNRFLTRIMMNQVDLITLREHLSLEELKRLGVTKPKIEVTADPVFSLEIKDCDVEALLKAEDVDLSKPLVGVLFRGWKNEEEYIKKMATICDYIVSDLGMNILFVPMKYPTDREISFSIGQAMTQKSYELKNKYDVNSMIKVIGYTKFVMSMRLHALLYAALMGVPMIGFIYDPKVRYFLEELKIYMVEDIDGFSVEKIQIHIDNILENYEEIQEKIQSQLVLLKEKAKDNEKYLTELVDL